MLCCTAKILIRNTGFIFQLLPEDVLLLSALFGGIKARSPCSNLGQLRRDNWEGTTYWVALIENVSQLSCFLCHILLPSPSFQVLLSRVLPYEGLYINFSESGSQVVQPGSPYLWIFFLLSLLYFLFILPSLPVSCPSFFPLSLLLLFFFLLFLFSLSVSPSDYIVSRPCFFLNFYFILFSLLSLTSSAFLVHGSSGLPPKWCLQLLHHHYCGLCWWYPIHMPFTRLMHPSCIWCGCCLIRAHFCTLLWRIVLSQLDPSLLEMTEKLHLTVFGQWLSDEGV